MKVRILFKNNFYWPQWKGKFFWRYFYEENKNDSDKIYCTNEKAAEEFINRKSWIIKPKKVIKEFEV
jgi:hypothetical protein